MRLPFPFGAMRAGTPAVLPASFSATLLSTLVPEVYTGSSTPTFTRATTAYVTDFEGLLKQVPSGASRHTGARFVRNAIGIASSQDASLLTTFGGTSNMTATTMEATGANALRYDSAASAAAFSGSCRARAKLTAISASPTVQMSCDGGTSYTAITVTSTPQVFSVSATNASAVLGSITFKLVNSGDKISIEEMMVENTTGQSNTNPSEYVSKGVLSAPYHGAGVDGCKYFTTQNGNTVASNVVTEATGAAISSATLLGYQAEGARTNYALWSRDLTNAAWVSGGGGIATAKTATGADGTANGATTLTASGANGTLIQSITRASAQRVTGCRIKRRTGSGTVNMTQDNGGTWTAVTVTAGWTAVEIPAATAANPNIGFRIVTSGDAIDVDFVMHEEGAFVSSPIPTTTVAVARNKDTLTYVSASNFGDPTGSIYAETKVDAMNGLNINCVLGMGAAGSFPLFVGATTSISTNDVSANLGTTGSGLSFLTAPRKVAAAWGGVTRSISKDGAAVASGVYDGGMNPSVNMTVGNYTAGSTYELYGNVRNLSLWTTKKTDAELAALTA